MKKILLILIAGIFVTACSESEGKEFEPYMESIEDKINEVTFKETEEKTNYVKITMENEKEIIVELYPGVAPVTVENFQKLVSEKFYDGIIFHRVIEGFMIQGGDPTGTGMSGSEETIKGEFSVNGFENILNHERGVLSMARTDDPNSASSQFFIMHETSTHLDGSYAAFGKVLIGMDVVDEIAVVSVDEYDKPLEDQVIKTITFLEIEE